MKTLKITAAASILALASAAMSPALAGACPAGKEGDNPLDGAATAPSGVTDDVIASIDLGDGYGLPGRNLRMRKLVVQPKGVVPMHSHSDRPANIYVVEGEITEYVSNCTVGITHRKGEVVAEKGSISHWWRNNSKRPAILLSADLPPPQGEAQGGM